MNPKRIGISLTGFFSIIFTDLEIECIDFWLAANSLHRPSCTATILISVPEMDSVHDVSSSSSERMDPNFVGFLHKVDSKALILGFRRVHELRNTWTRDFEGCWVTWPLKSPTNLEIWLTISYEGMQFFWILATSFQNQKIMSIERVLRGPSFIVRESSENLDSCRNHKSRASPSNWDIHKHWNFERFDFGRITSRKEWSESIA